MKNNDSPVAGFIDCGRSTTGLLANFYWSSSDDVEDGIIERPLLHTSAGGVITLHADSERLGLPDQMRHLRFDALTMPNKLAIPDCVGKAAFDALAFTSRTGEVIRDQPIVLTPQEARIMRVRGESLLRRFSSVRRDT